MSLNGRPDRAAERRRWQESGNAWDRWADPQAGPADRLNRPLLDAASVAPGHRVLDLASGAGEPAISLAERVGTAGFVVATDLVASMLAGGRRRARARTAIPMAFALADMEDLPFADSSFDRVTCRFGLMFVPDDRKAVTEAARVLRPGGLAALAVWGSLDDNTLFRELKSVLDDRLGRDPGDLLSILFRYAEPGCLRDLLIRAGLEDVTEEAVQLYHDVPADRPFWAATLDMAFAPRLRNQPPERLTEIHQAIAAHFKSLADADGMVRIAIHARIGKGRKPPASD